MNIQIIFEDKNIIVLNKPSGLVVHPFPDSDEYTLLDFLKEDYPEIFNIKNEKILQNGIVLNLGGVVHKLDRETSGIIVIAKNEKSFLELQKSFQERKIQKTYIAKVSGEINEKEFIIDAPLGREKKDYRQVANPSNPRGELREAVTHVKVLEIKDGNSLVELKPITGRTHQLRAHMKYINHPILGDKVYGDKEDGFERLMLHAKKIEFELGEEKYSFEVEIDW